MDPEFRRATLDDTLAIGQMLKRFYGKKGVESYGIAYDHASCLGTVIEVISHGVCILGHHSCAGAITYPFPYNHAAKVAQVVFWYFEQPKEIVIFDQLYVACRDAGATHINSAALGQKQIGKRFYTSHGMHLAESHYLRGYGNGLHREAEGVKDALWTT